MAQFISLSSLSAYFSSAADLMSPEGRGEFLGKMTAELRVDLCNRNNWNPVDLQVLLDRIHSPQNVLYYSWVLQSPMLEDLLTNGQLGYFEDRGKFLEHQLSKEFQAFLSPYLAEILVKVDTGDLEKVKKAFTFVCLLDSDHAALTETPLFSKIRRDYKEAAERMNDVPTETDLLAILQQLCSDDVLFCVNRLSRSMYATRLEFVDAMLSFMRAKGCTTRLANWMLKRLENIKLNREHQYKIEDLRLQLRKGNLQVQNKLESGRSSFRLSRLLLYFFLVLAAVFTVWVILYEPFSEVDPIEVADDTSFEQFSVEERRRIDSLLQDMSGHRDEEEDYDAGMLYPQGSAISIRKAFLNESLERIYEDLALDADLQEQGIGDSCTASMPFRPLEGTAKLSAKGGKREAMFRNESEYDIIVLVAENRTGGSVFTGFVKKGEVLKAKLNKGEIVVIIAGETFQEYDRPTGVVNSELPSSAFKEHFCNTDFNYAETVNTPYEVAHGSTGKCKFLISGSKGDYVDLVDVYDVLEPY